MGVGVVSQHRVRFPSTPQPCQCLLDIEIPGEFSYQKDPAGLPQKLVPSVAFLGAVAHKPMEEMHLCPIL